MFGLASELQQLESRGQSIAIGLIGAGQMGTDIVSQVSLMPALQLSMIADLDVNRALNAYRIAGVDDDQLLAVHTVDEANHALLTHRYAVTPNYRLITDAPRLEVIIESTGIPDVSARAALRTLYFHKHLVTMSVEMDITVGPLLKWYADQNRVIYAVGAGDEPTALYELYDFATSLGLTIIAVGKGKNNPLNRDATLQDLAPEAARRGLTPEMLVEFVDGSKTMIEMAAVANATGLVPDVFGMHGPRINISQFKETFTLKEQGGVLNQTGVVDFVIGDLAPGVFLIFTTDKPRLREALILRDMGRGPNYVLLRPFHLCSMEVPRSVAQAVLQGKSTMAPQRLVAEVVSVAKRDMPAGMVLERIGGSTHYGMIDRAERAEKQEALPIGIAKGATLRRDVKKGEVLTYRDVELPVNSIIVKLRELQNRWLRSTIGELQLRQALEHIVVSGT